MPIMFTFNTDVSQVINEVIPQKERLDRTAEIRTLLEPFVPMDTGRLASDVDVSVNGKTGTIQYNSPYAAAMYYGVSKKGNPLTYSKLRHPLATSHWDKAITFN